MKVAIGHIGSGGVTFFMKGILNAFHSLGHSTIEFIHGKVAPLDLFGEHPDIDLLLCYGYSSCLDRPLKKAIERYKPKVGLYVPAHPLSEAGQLAPKRPDLVYDVATESDIRCIDEIASFVDFVFIHHHRNVSNVYLDGWQSHVKKYIGVGMACDTVLYKPGKVRPELICDGSMTSGYWEYKARKLKPYLFSLCEPSKGYNIKIFGNGWPLANCLGQIPEHLVSDLWASTKVNLQIHEPQSEFLPEASERTFKVLGCGGFVLSDYSTALKHYFPNNELPIAKSPSEYQDMFRWFLNNPDERAAYISKGQKKILEEHTYIRRVNELLEHLS